MDASDPSLTPLLDDVAADIARMRIVDAVARLTTFLREQPDAVARARPGQWAELLRLAETHGVATDELLIAHDHAPANVRAGASWVHPFVMDYWRGLERRLAFRQSMRGEAGDRCVVVSLGPACLAWIMFNRWGFRNHPASVASFNPFCLAGHRAGAVAGMLRDGLEAYAPLDRIKEVAWRNGGIMVGRTDAAALWSHHVGAHWHVDDFRPFRDSIAELMGNLDRAFAMATDAPKLFVFGNTTVDETARLAPVCHALAGALDQRCNGEWRLLALNVPADPAICPAPRLEVLTPSVTVLHMPPPERGTLAQWWEPAIYNMPAAIAWESELANATRAAFAGWVGAGGA